MRGLETCRFDCSVGGALDVAFCDALLLVVGVFTAAKGDFDLDKRILEIQL